MRGVVGSLLIEGREAGGELHNIPAGKASNSQTL